MLSFKTSKFEMELIRKIADRALAMSKKYRVKYPRMTLVMDITACHVNGCPLDLSAMLTMPDFDFVHDVFGIREHINRETGKLEDCFVPRCALRVKETA